MCASAKTRPTQMLLKFVFCDSVTRKSPRKLQNAMIKLLIKTAVHIPCHKCSYHSSKNTASSLHSLLKWVVLGLNSGSLKNAAPLSSASRHLRRNQCILEQTKVTGPPTNFHIVDFMSSVSSTIVSAPTGGRCLVVVEKLLPLKLLKEFVTMYHVFV